MSVIKKCTFCHNTFTVSDNRPRLFCSLTCCWEWRRKNKELLKGTFTEGFTPWNKNTKGVMKVNKGSFQKGIEPKSKMRIGSVSFRKDNSGNIRAWVKIADNGSSYDWVLRAILVWQDANGPLPQGMIIHHKDRNSTNDDLTNLQAMTRKEHLLEHKHEYEERRKRAAAIGCSKRKRLEKSSATPETVFRGS